MLINLNDVPEEGKSWSLNSNTGELNDVLRDLIGALFHQAELTIRPLGTTGTFEMVGRIQTQLPEQCSRCGIDYDMGLEESFRNLLMPELETPRDAKFSRPNHFTDLHEQGPDVVEYQGHMFDAGEFFHELVALAEPVVPAPPEDEKGNCRVCKISLKNHSFNYDEELKVPNRPFTSLKGIKLS